LAVAGAVALVAWLAGRGDDDRASVERARRERVADSEKRSEMRRQARLDSKPRVTTADLHSTEPDSLLRTAEQQGYRIEALPAGHGGKPGSYRLEGARGERLAVTRTDRGQLRIASCAGSAPIESLVRQHTADRVAEQLTASGMKVRTARRANGDVEIVAHEVTAGRGGSAKVRAEVRKNGSAEIDIDCITGSRCTEIVNRVAAAAGATVRETRRKGSFFELPGEPTRTRVRN
jgi:hypothetical protein